MNSALKLRMTKIIESAKELEDSDPVLALMEEEIPIDFICEYFGWPAPITSHLKSTTRHPQVN